MNWENIPKPEKRSRLSQALAFQVGSQVSYNELGIHHLILPQVEVHRRPYPEYGVFVFETFKTIGYFHA